VVDKNVFDDDTHGWSLIEQDISTTHSLSQKQWNFKMYNNDCEKSLKENHMGTSLFDNSDKTFDKGSVELSETSVTYDALGTTISGIYKKCDDLGTSINNKNRTRKVKYILIY